MHIIFAQQENILKLKKYNFFLIFLLFWDYNITTIFSLSLSSLQTLSYTPLCCLSNSWPLSLIVVTWHMFLNITCSVWMTLLIWMFSGLTTWYWITNWYALPWERLFSHSQHSLIACSMYNWGLMGFPMSTLTRSLSLSFFSSHLSRHVGETWYSFYITRRHSPKSPASYNVPWAFCSWVVS